MRKVFKASVSAVASLALVSSLLAMPVSAYAGTGNANDVDSSTEWTVPDYYITNTVEVDGTLCKVITTWANAWAISGPDYIGVANSGVINQSGSSAGVSELVAAQTTTMLGIWASAVNEVPNAYNWNYFYNLALDASGDDADSEQVTAIDVANRADAGYDTASGVYACFKYRPEVIWCSNSLSSSSASTYASQISDGQYYTDGELVESGSESEYYIDGDEDYDIYIVDPSRDTVLGLLDSLYELAGYCERVIEDTADYNSDGAITAENVTWQTMNSLPRTTRYEVSSENAVSAREAALDVEKALRGAVYYTLAKIADGTTTKKTVAIVSGTIDTTGATATVIDYGGSYEGNRGLSEGKIGVSALTVDCLTTGTVVSESDSGDTYTATANELLEADYIWAGDGSLTVEEIESWLSENATTDEAKARVGEVEVISDVGAVVNSHGYTFEKATHSMLDISFFYPELWPDLELVSYWYDNVYHVNYDDLGICMLYGLGNATMPSGVELTDLPGDGYSNEDVDAKAIEGYEYYASTLATQSPYADDELLQPTDTYVEWAEDEIAVAELAELTAALEEATSALEEAEATVAELTAALEEAQAALAEAEADTSGYSSGYDDGVAAATAAAEEAIAEAEAALAEAQAAASTATSTSTTRAANTMTVKKATKTVKASKVKKKAITKKAITVSKAKGTVIYTKTSGSSKLTVNATTGKVKVKKGTAKGTYKCKVKVTACGNAKYKAKSKTVTVTIKVK